MAAPPRAPSPARACTRGCARGRRVAPRRCLFAPPPSVAGVIDGRRQGFPIGSPRFRSSRVVLFAMDEQQ
uniref:Uncharacterized protein n=1 Tax=Oryza sativa subsp. japonica TaxID=39947 RepID=Q654J1_ORYSJ|nr:hypothetical protein [Oryza sativa Japonica Group]